MRESCHFAKFNASSHLDGILNAYLFSVTYVDTWTSNKKVTEQQESAKEASVSQHDSGVESSVPSSQRSSPGTEAKLSFSHFGVVNTSTSVITSICNHPVSIAVKYVSHDLHRCVKLLASYSGYFKRTSKERS